MGTKSKRGAYGKPGQSSIAVRLGVGLAGRLQAAAVASRRSRNSLIELWLEELDALLRERDGAESRGVAGSEFAQRVGRRDCERLFSLGLGERIVAEAVAWWIERGPDAE